MRINRINVFAEQLFAWDYLLASFRAQCRYLMLRHCGELNAYMRYHAQTLRESVEWNIWAGNEFKILTGCV